MKHKHEGGNTTGKGEYSVVILTPTASVHYIQVESVVQTYIPTVS